MYHLYLSSSGFIQLLRTYQFDDLGGIVNIVCKVIPPCITNFWQLIQYNEAWQHEINMSWKIMCTIIHISCDLAQFLN